MVERAALQLLENVHSELLKSGLSGQNTGKWYATPRRLIVSFSNLAAKQEDRQVERRGPSAKAAFDENNVPTKALEGFCKSLGVAVNEIFIRDDYVWSCVTEKGKSLAEVLSECLPVAIRNISFDKTMRWGDGKTRFSRPIRWILAVANGEVVPFSIENVKSSNQSWGHRFLANQSFEANSLEELLYHLKEHFVEADPKKRSEAIRTEALKVSDGGAELTEELVEENTYLTEWPSAIRGEFREDFLGLPRCVLVTAMAKHERFFPIADHKGCLTNQFVSIINGGDPATVQAGNEWVLNARFNDAKFFFDEDSRHSLEDFLLKTERIVFQIKLGSIRMRSDRIARLAKQFSIEVGFSEEEQQTCEIAARLCKADLSCGLVSELPSLQGLIGAEYASRDGYSDAICEGIRSHYTPLLPPNSFGEKIAAILMCADQVDRLSGYLGIGEVPSGSSDPYALRKATTMLVEAQLSWPVFVNGIASWIQQGVLGYRDQSIELENETQIKKDFMEILRGRYGVLFGDIRHDIIDAVFAVHAHAPSSSFHAKLKMLEKLSDDVSFIRTGKRPANILNAAKKKGIALSNDSRTTQVSTDLFEHESENNLLSSVIAAQKAIDQEPENLQLLAEQLYSLKNPIDAFFDHVMVMTEVQNVRDNRLSLLACADHLFRRLGDFSVIVIEGE